ncbi:MAG: NifB/NifX family molybdenum-iron cluster-binding protein [Acidobacteriia bacterium]|nr:NifB/NifX family molybdenum-iron cluster-binding protein [Terriglobia bacterium]
MSKVGFTTLLNREDSVLSPHFGMAKWVMIRDDDAGETRFEQNTGLSGRAVVDILARAGCSDAVFTEIGHGAFRHLQEAGIRAWLAPANLPVPQLLERLSRGELSPAKGPTQTSSGTGRSERSGAGCCATAGHGVGVDRAPGCCGQQRHGRGHQERAGVQIQHNP